MPHQASTRAVILLTAAAIVLAVGASNARAENRREVFRACCEHADISVPTATGCITVDDGADCPDDSFVANCSDAEGKSCWPVQNSGASGRFSATPNRRGGGSFSAPGGGFRAN